MKDRGTDRVGRLIRSLIETKRAAATQEVVEILAHIAGASFSSRSVRVDSRLVGNEYLGYRFGRTMPSSLAHVGKRVLIERQWRYGITVQEYVKDLRDSMHHSDARAVVYRSRQLHHVGVLSPNRISRAHLGEKPESWLWVVYDADYDIITSGYQVSGIDKVWLPEGAQWLN